MLPSPSSESRRALLKSQSIAVTSSSESLLAKFESESEVSSEDHSLSDRSSSCIGVSIVSLSLPFKMSHNASSTS